MRFPRVMGERTFLLRIITISLLCAPILAASAETAMSTISTPGGPEILSHLNKSHPRLLASSNDFVRLKSQAANEEPLRSWEAALRAQATGILTAPPSRYEIPDGLRLLD